MTMMVRGMRISAFVVAALAAGCSLIVNTSDRAQCQTTADCDANPALRNRVCQQGFCALKQPEQGPTENDAGPTCVSTELCTQANSGRASICKRAGVTPCTPLVIDGDCPTITGKWKDPNAIIVGSLLPLTIKLPNKTSPESPYSKRLLRAIDLAAEEIDAAAPSGFQIANAQRPIAVLHCDSRGDPDHARQMFTHLVEDAGAQAVIVGWDVDLASIAPLATENKTTVICSDCFTPAPPGTTTWKILPTITSDAPLVAWRVADLEDQIKAQSPGDIRVAVLVDGAPAQRLFAEEVAKKLVFNGVSAAQNGVTKFLPIQTEDPRTHFIDYDAYDQQIADFAPDIVVVAMASDFPTYHLPRIEAKWPAGKPRPFYVVTEISYDAAPFEKASLDDSVIARISGTHPFTSPERANNIQGFSTRYRLSYKEPPNGNFSGYEAFYATALAIAANGSQPVLDGPRISAGFSSLLGGAPYDLGPGGPLNIALESLAKGQKIDIRGLYTDLDWDLATREIVTDMGMFCFTRQPGGPLEIHDVPAVRWSATTGQVTGTYACP